MGSKFILSICFIFILLSPLNQERREKVDLLLKEIGKMSDLKRGLLKANEALEISKSIQYNEGILRSELSKVVLFFDHFDNIECLRIIKEIEHEVFKSQNDTLIAHLLYLKGSVYFRLHLNNNAIFELNRALFFSKKIAIDNKRHVTKGKIYLAFGFVYDHMEIKNKHGVVLRYLKKGYAEFSMIKGDFYNDGLVIACNALGSYYSNTNDFNSAKKYFKKGINISKKIDCKNCVAYSFNRLANMYDNMANYDKAITNYILSNEISKSIGNLNIQENNYKALSLIYEKLKDERKQNESLKLLRIISDSIKNNDNLAVEIAVKGITGDIKLKHAERTGVYKQYIIITIIICLLLFYKGLIYLKKYKTEKENSQKLEEFLNEKILLIQSLTSSKSTNEIEEELKNVIRMAITKDILFFQKFNELFPDFKEKLLKIEPFLRTNDLKFCCYLKLNFDTKEIARYTGDSVRAVESKKYRLRKKFNISSKEDINLWFSDL